MGVGLDLNGIGFQDRGELSDLEQAMPDWLPGTVPMGLGDADGDLLAVAQGSLSMYHADDHRSEEHTSELQSLMRISYAVFCLQKKTNTKLQNNKYMNRVQTTVDTLLEVVKTEQRI